jgi:hypothetical protein
VLVQYSDGLSHSAVHHYFVPAGARGLTFKIERVEKNYQYDRIMREYVENFKKSPEYRFDTRKQNSIVYEDYYASNAQIHVAVHASTGAAIGKLSAVSGLDKWVDGRGYIYTLKVLEAQIELNGFMAKAWASAESEPGFSRARTADSSFFRGQAFELPLASPAPIHGIMDRQTFMIPYWKMVTRLQILKMRVLALCLAQNQPTLCDEKNPASPYIEVRDRIRAATTRLRSYADAAREIPLYRPTVTAQFKRNDTLDGLPNLPKPEISSMTRMRYERNEPIWFTNGGDEPETKVREAVNAEAIGPDLLRRLRELDRACALEVAAAERAFRR